MEFEAYQGKRVRLGKRFLQSQETPQGDRCLLTLYSVDTATTHFR